MNVFLHTDNIIAHVLAASGMANHNPQSVKIWYLKNLALYSSQE